MKNNIFISTALALIIPITSFADPAESATDFTQETRVDVYFDIGPYPYYYGPYDYYGPYGPYGPCFGPQGYGYGPQIYIGPGCPSYYHGPYYRHRYDHRGGRRGGGRGHHGKRH